MSRKTEKQVTVNPNGVGQQGKASGATSWNEASQSESKLPLDGREQKNPDDYNFYHELSKRFIKQQDQTLGHRAKLMKWFACITAMQLLVINGMIIVSVFWKAEMISTIFNFLKFFVGATFLELLGGLIIIVKFAFSHETYDMLKHLTYVEPKTSIKDRT